MGKKYSDILASSNTSSIQDTDIMILQRSDGQTYAFTANAFSPYIAQSQYTGSVEELNVQTSNVVFDLTKQIHKITPTTVGPYSYVIPVGTENQIINIVPNVLPTNPFANEYSTVSISNARWVKSGTMHEGSATAWVPFTDAIYNQFSGSCVLTLIFTDGHWNLPHSYGL